MNEVFIDTDIILDLFLKRQPFYPAAARLFSLAEHGTIKAYISPVIFSNLYYILRKGLGQELALIHLRKLRLLTNIVNVDETTIDMVLASRFKDLEDAIQYYAALDHGISVLITRNADDYVGKELSIVNAEEYLEIMKHTIQKEK